MVESRGGMWEKKLRNLETEKKNRQIIIVQNDSAYLCLERNAYPHMYLYLETVIEQAVLKVTAKRWRIDGFEITAHYIDDNDRFGIFSPLRLRKIVGMLIAGHSDA